MVTVKDLSFELPSRFESVQELGCEFVEGESSCWDEKLMECYATWKSNDGESISVLIQQPGDKTFLFPDRGPMIVEKEKTIRLEKHKFRIYETSMWYGLDDRVLVSSIDFADLHYLVVAREMCMQDFESFLKTFSVPLNEEKERVEINRINLKKEMCPE